jgi:hypothetical protein
MTHLNRIVHSYRETEFFLQLEMFDLCTTGDRAHIDTIFKFLPFTHQHGCIGILILHSCRLAAEIWTTIKYNFLGKKILGCSFSLYRFRKCMSYAFPIINLCNPGVHYETPCINPLTPNGHYSYRTALLTSRRCICNINSTNIRTEYFKHAA